MLNGIVLPRISYAVMKQAGIAMRGERAGDLSEEQIRRVAEVLKGYVIPITGRKGLHEAQVSAGGVICSQFSPENLESVAVSGLHAAGETLNVDGDCGGFNLMFAFASGILAGLNGRIPGYEVNE